MQQEFDVFARYLSYKRLNSYKFRNIDPIVLYKWNLALSEVFYPLLNTIEIALRNRLHIGISEIIGDEHWLINRNQKISRVSGLNMTSPKKLGLNASLYNDRNNPLEPTQMP